MEENGNSHDKKQIRFDFRDMSEATVTDAKLYVYLKDSPRLPKKRIRRKFMFFVWERLPPKPDTNGPSQRLLERRTLELLENTGDWFEAIDVTKEVQKWIAEPEKNLGITVESTDYFGNRLAIIAPENDEEEAHVCI